MGSLFLSSPLLLFLCFHWMVLVFPEAEPLELLGGGIVRELWRHGMWMAYFYAFPVQPRIIMASQGRVSLLSQRHSHSWLRWPVWREEAIDECSKASRKEPQASLLRLLRPERQRRGVEKFPEVSHRSGKKEGGGFRKARTTCRQL